MKAFVAIYLKEMRAYFYSPIAYVLAVGFLVITGYFFYSGVAFYSLASMQSMQNPMFAQMNLQEMLVGPLQANMCIIMMLIVPLLTMRLLSEEKKSGTIELLLSYPVSDAAVVLAKFAAAWTVLAAIIACTGLQIGFLAVYAQPHWPSVFTGYLGLVLLGGAFVALGMLASASTENQIVAAAAGFASMLMLWIMGWSSQVVGPEAGALLKGFSISTHFEGFAKGLIDTADLAYFILFMVFFLFSAIRVLEAKRWKG